MGISEIMLLAVTVIGAILLAFSIFLFVKRKGTVGGPVLLSGVLLTGLGVYFFVSGGSSNEVSPSTASSETRDEDSTENTEETSDEGESKVNPPSTESSDEETLNYEGAVVYEIGQVLTQFSFAADGVTEVYDYNTYTEWEYAANELALLDESIATAEEVVYTPEGYSDFQVAYSQFLNEMQYLSDELYYAAEDYYYEEDMTTLEEYMNMEDGPSYLIEAFETMKQEADEVFQHEDFAENIENQLNESQSSDAPLSTY